MKTLSESLESLVLCSPEADENLRRLNAQQEFRAELDTLPLAGVFARTIVDLLLYASHSQLNGKEATDEQFDQLLLELVMNGLTVGIAVGVRMEAAEFPPAPTPTKETPSWWRRG